MKQSTVARRVGFALAGSIALIGAALAQDQGRIQIFDMMSPGERKWVQPDWTTIEAQPLGTRGNPVRTFLPQGQHDYLRRLVCADGSPPAFRRAGSVGPGPYTSILDTYDVRCGERATSIIIDMYHPGYVECRPVPGFTMRGACPST